MSRTMIDALKTACVDFFYWWHNTPGSNTEQGFDQWMKTVKGEKDAAEVTAFSKSCVGCTFVNQVAELHRLHEFKRLTDEWPDEVQHPRVLIYTEGVDFEGEQFFDVPVSSLDRENFENPSNWPEVCEAATHWAPRPVVR